MYDRNPSTELDPNHLKDLKRQQEILQANLDLLKLNRQLEEEKLKAEVEKVKLEADKLKTSIPSGTKTPLSGETKIDEKFGYIAQLAIHKAIGSAAREIAEQVRAAIPDTNPARILLVDTLDFCGEDIQALQVSNLTQVLKKALCEHTGQIDKLLKSIEPVEPTGEEVFTAAAPLFPVLGQLLSAAPGAISWGAEIASYFNVEDTYKSVEVSVPYVALQACVANAFIAPRDGANTHSKSITVCFPSFHTFGNLRELPIFILFDECAAAQSELRAKSEQLKMQIESLANANEAELLPQTKVLLKLAEVAYASSQSLIQAFEEFRKLVTSTPEGKSYSPLARVAMREYLKRDGGHPYSRQGENRPECLTYLLYLNLISSGGELALHKTLWLNRNIVFLGGCVVAYVLADLTGNTLAAGTLSKLTQTRYKRGQSQRIQIDDILREQDGSGGLGEQIAEHTWARMP